ncbi:sulfotransferase-like domain-containing protein [Erythrobacter sp. EC-HK427]|uniref:sulfotransferase-like domain-containing protein n=1 Tax=Erythrobacter sp. EC-HK427 TaxID=2038396 RepID=UPI001256B840|nr:HAD family hydrolase [Erythrobacter sp. EC-HK427]VVT15587.1 Branched-chain amino acid aminotransferase [Erythrobacter sp. EC-HK427]
MTFRIAMWSGPRNLSTAMMRSFSSRADTAVSDEPFYGAYLRETGDPQPMMDAVMASMECDWHRVAGTLRGAAPDGKAVWYQKHMSHHMEGPVSIADFPEFRHAFLIRDPVRVAASYANKRTEIRPEHLGTARQRDFFEREADRLGHAPPVVDSAAVLANPAGVLEALCDALGILWDTAMLGWEKGPHPADGVWGAHWYDKVNASTGFGDAPGGLPELPGEYARVAEQCRADYEALAHHAIRA